MKGLFVGRVFSANSPQPIVCDAPCLGYSFNRHEEVLPLITRSAPVTFWLAIGAFIIWIVVGISRGIYAALRRGRWQDRLVVSVSLVGYSLPSFFIGLVLIFFVVIKLQLLPFPSYVSPFENPVQFIADDDPAVDRAGHALRGLLHAPDAQPDARDPRRGLHPHGAREGPARAHGHRASTPCARA